MTMVTRLATSGKGLGPGLRYPLPMVVAQAIGEYGGVAGAVSGAFTRAYNGVQSFLYDAELSTWMIIGAVVVVVWLLADRHERRSCS